MKGSSLNQSNEFVSRYLLDQMKQKMETKMIISLKMFLISNQVWLHCLKIFRLRFSWLIWCRTLSILMRPWKISLSLSPSPWPYPCTWDLTVKGPPAPLDIGPHCTADIWWSSLETCSFEDPSPASADTGGYWSIYGRCKQVVRILLQCFLVNCLKLLTVKLWTYSAAAADNRINV